MLCVFATVGLLRRVAWGRFLVSFINVMVAFTIAAALLPDHDDHHTGGPLLEQLLGTMPPHWIAWIIIVASAVLVLLPSVLIGFRKRWFRSAWW
jgi:ABC-type maltose transport system permease subunit